MGAGSNAAIAAAASQAIAATQQVVRMQQPKQIQVAHQVISISLSGQSTRDFHCY